MLVEYSYASPLVVDAERTKELAGFNFTRPTITESFALVTVECEMVLQSD